MVNARLCGWLLLLATAVVLIDSQVGWGLFLYLLLPVPILVHRSRLAGRWLEGFTAFRRFPPASEGSGGSGGYPASPGPRRLPFSRETVDSADWQPASVRMYLPLFGSPVLVLTDPENGPARRIIRTHLAQSGPCPGELEGGAWYAEFPDGSGAIAQTGAPHRVWRTRLYSASDVLAADRVTHELPA